MEINYGVRLSIITYDILLILSLYILGCTYFELLLLVEEEDNDDADADADSDDHQFSNIIR